MFICNILGKTLFGLVAAGSEQRAVIDSLACPQGRHRADKSMSITFSPRIVGKIT